MTRLGKIGLVIITLFFIVAIFAPLIAPYDPRVQNPARDSQPLEERLKPSREHPLGLDDLGRDVMSRIVYGARISMRVGVTVVLISSLIGMLIGAVSGYYGGWVDRFFSGFLFNVFLAFPSILLAIAMVAFLGPSLNNLILALSVIGWVGYARLVRGQALRVDRQLDVLPERLGHRIPVLWVVDVLGVVARSPESSRERVAGVRHRPVQPDSQLARHDGRFRGIRLHASRG